MPKRVTVAKAISIDEENKKLTAVMTTRNKDRDGDIVETEGIRIENFMRNPVVLWAHDRKSPPIAKINNIMRSPDTMWGEVEFDQKDPFAMMIFNKYAKGFLTSWSIGFDPDQKALEPLMNDAGQITGYHFKQSELMELSGVPIPANADALVREFESVDRDLARRFAKGLDGDMRTAFDKAFGKSDHNNEVTDGEPGWGNVDKTSLPEVAFAWEAPGTDDARKSTWKYPHHWVQGASGKDEDGIWSTGKLYLHEGGLRAAWAAAMGARSGARAPASVINHLQKHRRALGMESQERGKVYVLRYPTTGESQLLTVKDFDEIPDGSPIDDLFVAADARLGANVFKKSLDERADKIPTVYKSGTGFGVEISFEAIQVSDGLVKEARIIEVEVTLPKPAENAESIPPEGPDPATEKDEGEDGAVVTEPVDADTIIDDLESEILGISARIAGL